MTKTRKATKTLCGCDRDRLKERSEFALKLCVKLKPLIVTSSIFGTAFLVFVYIMYSTGGMTSQDNIYIYKSLPVSGGHGDIHLKEDFKQGNENYSGISRLKLSAAFDVSSLGNLMFVYASLFGMAIHTNREAIIPQYFNRLSYFLLTASEGNSTIPSKDWPEIVESKSNSFDRVIYEHPKTSPQNIRVIGYLQSWMYFQGAIEKVKREFTFKPQIKKEATTWLRNTETKLLGVKKKHDSHTIVGVHVRRGDMTRHDFLDFGYTVADKEFLHRAMDYFAKKYKNVLFIYCSDDIAWGKTNIIKTGHTISFSEGHRDIVDLAILTSCDHVITTTGTFSWWAGFLSPGEVVYYKDFPRKGSRLGQGFSKNKTDYFYPGWIGM